MQALVCKKCSWSMKDTADFAAVVICPNCRSRDITIVRGSVEELDEYFTSLHKKYEAPKGRTHGISG